LRSALAAAVSFIRSPRAVGAAVGRWLIVHDSDTMTPQQYGDYLVARRLTWLLFASIALFGCIQQCSVGTPTFLFFSRTQPADILSKLSNSDLKYSPEYA